MAVGAVDFDHADAVGVQVAGEAGAVGAGALDTHQVDLTEGSQPSEQPAVAGRCGLEGLHAEQATAMVQGGRDVHVEVGVDTSGDPKWHGGHQSSPSLANGWGDTAPAGTTDRTATGL